MSRTSGRAAGRSRTPSAARRSAAAVATPRARKTGRQCGAGAAPPPPRGENERPAARKGDWQPRSVVSSLRLLPGLFGVGGHLHFDNPIRVGNLAVARLVALLDLVDVLHTGHDLAPDCILPVERRRRAEH